MYMPRLSVGRRLMRFSRSPPDFAFCVFSVGTKTSRRRHLCRFLICQRLCLSERGCNRTGMAVLRQGPLVSSYRGGRQKEGIRFRLGILLHIMKAPAAEACDSDKINPKGKMSDQV